MSSGHNCTWCRDAWGTDTPARHHLVQQVEEGEDVWLCGGCRRDLYFKDYVEVFE